jgi:DNA polymerase IV (archaeal DinB-like DNA polymerase)
MHVIAHLDMDCFFAACEVKKDPSLAGKPVIIGATGTRGVVSTASYEARKFGVHSALPIGIARSRCPHGIYLPGDGNYYRKQSRMVMEILQEFADDLQQVSVDEAYMNLTSFSENFSSWEEMGKYIQMEVLRQVELSCSLGIAYGRIVAKIASDYKKPAGVTVVRDQATFLAPLPIEKFPGVGKKSLLHYHRHGIKTIGDLAKMTRGRVLELFGMYGVRKQQIARGEIVRGLYHRGRAKSVSRERTYIQDVTDTEVMHETLQKLCAKVHNDLAGREFKRVSLKLRYADFSTITRDMSLPLPMQSVDVIASCIGELFTQNYSGGEVRLLGVKVSNLRKDDSVQQKLHHSFNHVS